MTDTTNKTVQWWTDLHGHTAAGGALSTNATPAAARLDRLRLS